MEVRKQLLERELNKLGFRKAATGRPMSSSDSSQQEGQSSHPQADDPNQHGE